MPQGGTNVETGTLANEGDYIVAARTSATEPTPNKSLAGDCVVAPLQPRVMGRTVAPDAPLIFTRGRVLQTNGEGYTSLT